MSDKLLLSAIDIENLKRNSPNFSDRGQDLADKLDDLQKGKIKTIDTAEEGINFEVSFSYNVTTGAASILIFDANAPFKFEITDVIIQPRGASTSGTMKITDGTNDITDAIICAVDKTIGRASTIDDAYSTIGVNGTLEIVCAGNVIADTIGLVTIRAIAKN